MRAKFTVREGRDQGTVFCVEDGQAATLGRSSKSDVSLHDPGISRVHCQLTYREGKVEVTDLNSSNGTFVNKRRVHDAQLSEQDQVTIGHTTIALTGIESSTPSATPESEPQPDIAVEVLDETGKDIEPAEPVDKAEVDAPSDSESSALSAPFSLDDSDLADEPPPEEKEEGEGDYDAAFAQTVRNSADGEAAVPDPDLAQAGGQDEAQEEDGGEYHLASESTSSQRVDDKPAASDEDMPLALEDLPAASPADDSVPSAQAQEPALGTEIAGCQVVERLEHNDICLAFKGVQQAIGRDVGLHLLRPEIAADVLERERFLSGARAAARVDHRHFLRVYEAGEAEAWAYMITEHVEGIIAAEIMDRWGRRGKFDEKQAGKIVRRVAKALHAAHAQGIVHLNIRPQNVVVTTRGVVKLVNLSLVRVIQEERADAAAESRAIRHDVHYRSPEEVTDAAPVDHRADLYSLGATLFAMVTGHAPFESVAESDLAHEVRQGDVGSPARLNPGVPRPLCDIVAKAMAKKPEDRFQTAREMRTALDQALQTM